MLHPLVTREASCASMAVDRISRREKGDLSLPIATSDDFIEPVRETLHRPMCFVKHKGTPHCNFQRSTVRNGSSKNKGAKVPCTFLPYGGRTPPVSGGPQVQRHV